MLRTAYKVSVGILLALYSFIAFIAVALSGLCADSNACTAPLTAAQITVAVYTVLQWPVYVYVLVKRPNNSRTIMRTLVYIPLVTLVGFILFANFVDG
jgi:hypothetical protein